MKLYIMRHGETDANTRRVLQGRMDNPLNENGKEQAVKAGRALCDVTFDVVYSSPLKRALETAELASGLSRERLVVDERLQEISFGVMEGTCCDEMEERYQSFFRDPDSYDPPEGGESLPELIERVGGFLEEIKGRFPDKNILLVSHGAAIHAMAAWIMGLKMSRFWDMALGNCGVLEVTDEGGVYKIVKECQIRDKNYSGF